MKPTQEQILSALNELVRENKTELKAEKIELGLKDIEKLVDQTYKIEDRAAKGNKIILKARKDTENLRSKISKESKGLESSAKELGLNAQDIPAYKELEKALKNLARTEKAFLYS